jgi:hypothetical protein
MLSRFSLGNVAAGKHQDWRKLILPVSASDIFGDIIPA